MSNNYNFKEVEEELLSTINLKEAYKSNPHSKNVPFVTVMPPPNITGSLHIGHALVLTLQDILTRFNRMHGLDTLWQVGVDHAGIATQLVVERNLAAKGIKKEDLGEEGFTEEVLKWKEEAQNKIIEQIQKIGASCDFSNIAFTFSKEFNEAVNKVFVTLFEEGLIYQDYRLVNWDTKFSTAISDLEVTNKEEEGKLYYIKYSISKTESIIIATTRPETMFGDTAIAVNPNDERYKHLIGKKAIIPIINKEIPIVSDDYSIAEKGSGAVKITPAHDFNDFEVGKRHNLPLVIVIDQAGKLNNNVPKEFQGLTVKEARTKVIDTLTTLGNLEKIEKHLMQVPYGDRSNTVIEPLPSKQWFLNVNSMAKEAIEAVKNKEVKLIPTSWENLYFNWLNNIKPWCISRQLWWGHKIPVWHTKDGKMFAANSKEEALEKAKAYYKTEPELFQDDNVLDTWFSSSLWPFVTLGWPNLDSERLQKYYPTSTLVTGFDIIFFWVARIIMMGKHILKAVPFKEVYLHNLILDEKGQKMSKTKGNVVDPLELMNKYGTDALRFTLANYASSGQNIKFSEKTLEGFRNFITKLWNAYRFLQYYECTTDSNYDPKTVTSDINKWILLELQNLIDSTNQSIRDYQFSESTNKLYHFIWNTFCDWYIEIIKIVFTNEQFTNIKKETSQTAAYVFNKLVIILHPIVPFITQHLFNLINKKQDILLTNVTYPTELLTNTETSKFEEAKNNIKIIVDLINRIRSIRAYLKIAPKATIKCYIESNNIVSNYTLIIERLARLNQIIFTNEKINSDSLFKDVISSNLIIGLDIKSVIDVNTEKQRLNIEKNKLTSEINSINARLSNSHFTNKAPQDIVDNVKNQHKELTLKLSTINDIITKL